MSDSLTPDTTIIRAHLERLFRRARLEYPDGRCEIAWADARGAVNSAETFGLDPDSLDNAAACAARYNAAGRNTYVGVNPRKSTSPPFGRASTADVEIAFFNFIDGDSPDTAARLRQAAVPHSWAVTTGHIPNPRPQAYWELEEPTRNLKAWSDRQLALAEFFAADHVIDPPRIMRLAGTVNYPAPKKAAKGYVVEQVTIRTIYDGEEREPLPWQVLDQAYPLNGHAHQAPSSNGYDPNTGEVYEDQTSRPNFQTDRVDPQTYVDAIKAGHNLHNNARNLIAHLVATGRPNWLIREFLTAILKPVSDGGTLGQVAALIRSAREKWDIPDPEEDFTQYSPHSLPIEWFADIKPSLNASDFVENLLCDAGMSVIYGESNCGKTFFMTDLAYHIAAGRPWRKRQVEQGGVIYVALEGGFGIRNRLAAIKQHYQTTEPIPLAIIPCSINLLDLNADTTPLIELIQATAQSLPYPVRLVVIDTLSRAMNGGNENAPEDMGKIVKSADRIREQTGAHVAFVHHSGKDTAKGARGHSLLRAATDTEIEISRAEGSSVSVAAVKKQRELEIDGSFVFELKQIALGTNNRGKDVTSCVVVEAEGAPGAIKPHGRMSDVERSFFVEIVELFNRGDFIEKVAPRHDMPIMDTLRRECLRDHLVERGILERNASVMVGVTAISNAERARLFRVLAGLKNKGFIESNVERIWLLK